MAKTEKADYEVLKCPVDTVKRVEIGHLSLKSQVFVNYLYNY